MAKPGRRRRQIQQRTPPPASQPGSPSFAVPYREVASRAQEFLRSWEVQGPGVWAELEAMGAEARGELGWPEWCWLPVACAREWALRRAVAGGAGASPAELERWIQTAPDRERGMVNMAGELLAAATTWRVTRGIYRFHPELRQALLRTPVEEVAPEVLLRLPEWCVYVDLDGGEQIPSGRWVGFYAHLDWHPSEDWPTLRVVLAVERPVPQRLVWLPSSLPLRHRTLSEARSELRLEVAGSKYSEETEAEWSTAILVCLPLLLYLASEEAEIRDRRDAGRRPERRRPERDGGGPNWWEVGYRVGTVLGRAREPVSEGPTDATVGALRSPAPHVRRAHYHLYWTGPGRREPRIRWLHPILVGDREGHELPPTIHRVETTPS